MSYIQNVQSKDLLVTGAATQSVLNNNIFNTVTGAGPIDLSTLTSGVSYSSFSVQISTSAGISAGAIFFEGSIDGVTYTPVPVWESTTGNTPVITAINLSGSTAKVYSGNITLKFLRCRISTALVGGTVQAFPIYSSDRSLQNSASVNLANISPSSSETSLNVAISPNSTTSKNIFFTGGAGNSTLNSNILSGLVNSTLVFDVIGGLSTSTPTANTGSFTTQVVGSAGISAGAVIFEGSNDGVTYTSFPVTVNTSLTPITSAFTIPASTSLFFSGDLRFKNIRCRISTAFVGGTVQTFTVFNVREYPAKVIAITDGTNVATVKAASTASVTTDTALVVAMSPNSGANSKDLNITGAASATAGDNIFNNIAGSAPTDVSTPTYRSFYTQILGDSSQVGGVIVFEGSNDGATYFAIPVTVDDVITAVPIVGNITVGTNVSKLYSGKCNYKLIKCRIATAPSAGTIQAFTRLSTEPYGVQDLTVGVIGASTAPSKMGLGGSVYNSTDPILTTGQSAAFQGDSSGKLKTASFAGIPVSILDIPSATITASATSATFTPTSGQSYIVTVPVTASSGTSQTMSIEIQETYDGVFWNTVYTFPVITGAGTQSSPPIPLNGVGVRYVRTLGGTTPSFTSYVIRTQVNTPVITGEYNITPLTLTNGQKAALQFDANAKLKVSAGVPADTAQVSGSITAVDVVSTTSVGMNNQAFIIGTPTAASFLTYVLASSNSLRFQVTGTWVGTIQAEASIDAGVTYTPIMVNQVGMHTFVTSFTSNINGTVNAASFTHFRLRATAWTSGTANILVVNSANLGSVQLANSLNGGTIAYPVDKSGTITVGGTAQVLMPINSSRGGWWVMNTSAGTLYINELGTATSASIPILPNQEYTPPTITAGAISILGTTTAQSFLAREWNGIPATSSVLNGGLTAVGPLPASGSLSVVSAIPKSTAVHVNGTITLGGTAQVLLALNLSRVGFELFNNSAGDLWIGIGTAPTVGTGIKIASGSGYVTPVNISYTNAINIIGAVTAQAYTVVEY